MNEDKMRDVPCKHGQTPHACGWCEDEARLTANAAFASAAAIRACGFDPDAAARQGKAVLDTERDAARYRWLRDSSAECVAQVCFEHNLTWRPVGSTLDAAIDAAMKQGASNE